ncbi:MAG: hypothetical protein NVS9B2_28270 [Steroidobacteraceae bacterium]
MNVVGTPLDELFEGVDDLIKRVADTENPEIRRSRAKVHASMRVAKSAFAHHSIAPRRAAGRDVDLDDEDSEQALGVALLVGVGLGVIMSLHP